MNLDFEISRACTCSSVLVFFSVSCHYSGFVMAAGFMSQFPCCWRKSDEMRLELTQF